MSDLPTVDGGFACILADPPWGFRTFAGEEEIPTLGEAAYEPMSLDDMKAMPVSEIAAADSLMVMWVVSSHIPQAIELGEAWGFTYRSLGPIWAKARHPDQIELFDDGPICSLGMGYWFRQQAEIALVFGRGSPERQSAGVRQIIYGARREHSRKPEEQYARVEALVGGPRLELFARQQRPGWVCWGNQADKFGVAA